MVNECNCFHDNVGSDSRVELVVLNPTNQAREKGGRGGPAFELADITTSLGAPLFAQFAKGGYGAAGSMGFC